MPHSTSTSTQPTRPAPKQFAYADDPFKTEHADMILRSTDSVQFRVHTPILTMSSERWESLITSMRNRAPKDRKGRLIVDVGEDSDTLFLLLSTVYPVDTPSIESVWGAFSVLEAARKYQMAPATKIAKQAIKRFAETMPLRVYALAAQRNWEHEMQTAALASLNYPIQEMYAQELEKLPASVYWQLLNYHRTCGKAAVGVVTDLSWMGEIAVKTGWQPCWSTCSSMACKRADSQPTMWYRQYVSAVRQVLHARPGSKTLKDPALMDEAIEGTATCDGCRRGALRDLRTFNQLLGSEIERKIENIQLQIK